MNKYELEYLVVKTYEYTKDLVLESRKHKEITEKVILAFCDAKGIEYERDYILENIREEFDAIECFPGKIADIIKTRHIYF